MITSLSIFNNHIFSLANASTLSVYNLSDFFNLSHQSLPKLQSQLGISLRKPVTVFELPFVSDGARFAQKQNHSIQSDIVVIYDRKNVVGLDAVRLTTSAPEIKTLFELNINSLTKGEIKDSNISTVTLLNNEQAQSQSILTTTNSGEIHLLKINQTRKLQFVKSTSIQSIQLKNKIVIELEQENFQLIPNGSQSLLNVEYICATEVYNSKIYFATNTHKLLAVNKDTLELVATFDNTSVNEMVKNSAKSSAMLGNPKKIVIVRNSLLVLYSKVILEYNIYTHTLTNTISLPVSTLDLTMTQSTKTLESSLLMVGECNSLYSVIFPVHETSKTSPVLTRSVNISSRLGKCLQTKNNLVFVAGSDGAIDVFANGEMHLAVLVQKK